MKRHLSGIAGLLALAACHSQTQPATTADAPAAATIPPTPAAAADSPGASYRVYRGLLPGQADSITLHLVTAPQPRYDAGGISRYGSYYGADGHPYEVQALSSAPDSVALIDLSPEHGGLENSPAWRLKQQPDGNLAGTVGGQPVRLRRVAPPVGGLTFAVRCLTDSLAAYPKKADSPHARIDLQALVPTGGPPALATNMLRDLRGDTLNGLPAPALPALYQQQRDTFYKEYCADIADMLADTPADERPSLTLNYDDQTSTSVLFHKSNLLSLGFFSYSYSGGAHGLNGTTVASYDLRTGRRLHYDDIFLPTAQARLPALLEQAVRQLLKMKPNEALDEQLLVAKIPLTHNVCLTAGGALFVYEPYEIASYAQGEVRVFVPLMQLRPLLREGLPLPGAASVAAR
ncbi:MAG: DUF3298 domain-containing protein [Janthinobacterium lividum]